MSNPPDPIPTPPSADAGKLHPVTVPTNRPIGRLAEIQSKNKKKILANTGATTSLRGHAKASTKRNQAKRDGRK